MSDIEIRKTGRAGRITLTREKALNALSPEMSVAIEAALDAWAEDAEIALIVIDASGDRAFCAGGDIAQIYQHGMAGDHDYARAFWRQEYRLNAKLARFSRPVISFMQGFVMGGGVGLGCHVGYRVVGESTKASMPECAIGLIPDVGGTLLLGNAPGALGEYLGLSAARMGPRDAIYAGFADHFVPEADWPALIAELERSGDVSALLGQSQTPPPGELEAQTNEITAHFSQPDLPAILQSLQDAGSDWAGGALKTLSRNSPFAMACTLQLVRDARQMEGIEEALAQEYRYTYRAQKHGDLLEGVRAMIIDKDKSPKWHPAEPGQIRAQDVSAMLAPLGDHELVL
ncbi:MAG: enoyl-CoA hydratase/isomerase family protein [Mangrovicoccus sp.]|nr:enoyl-CoA hydratase/isomerase family protein [Mangrovicoccus sp.]